jgi:hypothetical protein
VCSTPDAPLERLARISEAIDEVAAAAHASSGEQADLDRLSGQLASIWAMLAELDPGLAARLPGYDLDTE